MLSAPLVVPPATPWSRSLRVKNQKQGAVVAIFADGQRIGGALASSPDIFVPLDPGFQLQAGQELTASQEKGGEKSGPAAKASAVKVLKAPTYSMLGKILSHAPLAECGTCVWLQGVVPGADVTVTIGTAPPLTVTAEWTAVHVDVTLLSPTKPVVVRQAHKPVIGPTVIGPDVSFPKVLPKGERALLPAPKVEQPLLCER